MELKPAFGSLEMQRALASPCVHAIVHGMLQIKKDSRFRLIARFLKDHDRSGTAAFASEIRALKINALGRPDTNGTYTAPAYICELIESLEALYAQNDRDINFQRGAIVELLTMKLVQKRCKPSECYGNYCFVHGRYKSQQVDISVFSEIRLCMETYTCKANCKHLETADCTNLISAVQQAQNLDYETHIGVVCFDSSRLIEQKIHHQLSEIGLVAPIKAYGLDNLFDLEISPFL